MLDDWESRYRYLIELGRRLPPLPDAVRTDANLIHGCQSQAWIGVDRANGKLRFLLDSDAHIVRGLIAILMSAVNDEDPRRCSRSRLRGPVRQARPAEALESRAR